MAFPENLKWLLQHRQKTPKELADFIAVKPNSISNYTNGVSSPNYELLNKIVKFLEVSADEILYSDLPKNGLRKIAPNIAPIIAPNDKKIPDLIPKVVTVDIKERDVVSLVPVKAAAGYLNGYGDPEYIETLPTLYLPGMDGASHRAFELRGHSMMPNLHSGSIQIGRWVESLKDIKDRRVYIIVSKYDGIVIKRVLNRVKQDGKLIMISDNDNKKEYPNYPIEADDVLEVWYWRGAIIREVPEPGTQYARLNDLESRLSLLENRYLSTK